VAIGARLSEQNLQLQTAWLWRILSLSVLKLKFNREISVKYHAINSQTKAKNHDKEIKFGL
jgi:hypothetical protein